MLQKIYELVKLPSSVMTTRPEFIASMPEISQRAATKSTLSLPLSLQYISSSMRFYDRWIQREKINRPQKLLWLFLPHLYLQNTSSWTTHCLCFYVFLQWVTLFAINNRTEKQKVINKPNIWLKAVKHISSVHTVSEWDALMQMGLPLIFPMASYKTLSNS